MILAGNVADEIYPLQTLSLTLYYPKASKKQIKAGLLTCFVCTTFPPKGSGHKEYAEHYKTHSYGYSLGFTPKFPFHSWRPMSP